MNTLLILTLLAGIPGHANPTLTASKISPIVGQATVIDGDTIVIHGKHIRLAGIDAPESSQRCVDVNGTRYACGQDSAYVLADIIGRHTVTCQPEAKDKYGRFIATCFVAGVDINAEQVRQGQAIAYTHFSKKYVVEQYGARKEGKGIWGGSFEEPWKYRQSHPHH